MAAFEGLFLTDEDLAIRARSDFPLLVQWSVLAFGTDGGLNPAAPWELTSASNDFAAAGVETGHVVRLDGSALEATKPYGQTAILLGVDSATAGTLTLKPLGLAPGVGIGPGAFGTVTGVRFLVATAAPQIARATADVRVRLRADSDADLESVSDVRTATTELVLCRLYMDHARQVTAGDSPEWVAKGKSFCAAAEAALARLETLYSAGPGPRALVSGPLKAGTDLDAYPYEPWEPGYKRQQDAFWSE